MRRKTARRDKVEIYLHFIWTTWDRLPLVAPEWEAEMYAIIHGAVDHEGCFLLAVGGVTDHVHCLVSIRSTTRVCDLVKAIKATSAQFSRRQVEGFKWRPTYAVFSVSRWNVAQLKRYIRAQKEHHEQGTTLEGLEVSDETYWYDDENSG